jgi:transposase
MPRRSPYQIELSAAEREWLESRARRYTLAYRDVLRAKIILLAAEGRSNKEIARELHLPRPIVSKWRKRHYQEGSPGLQDRPRGGRPPDFSPSGGV